MNNDYTSNRLTLSYSKHPEFTGLCIEIIIEYDIYMCYMRFDKQNSTLELGVIDDADGNIILNPLYYEYHISRKNDGEIEVKIRSLIRFLMSILASKSIPDPFSEASIKEIQKFVEEEIYE